MRLAGRADERDAPHDHADAADVERVWRWFLAGTIASACCGMSYTFGAFSGALKQNFALSQGELQTISVVGNLVAGALGAPLGMLVDATAPQYSLVGGGLVLTFAYAAFWAFATKLLPIGGVPPVVALAGCIGLAAIGSSVVMTTVIALAVRTLPAHERGTLIGFIKAYVGMGAGGLTVLYQGVMGRPLGGSDVRSLDFILAVAVEVLCVTVIPATFLPRKSMRVLRAAAEASPATSRRLLGLRTEIVYWSVAGMLIVMSASALLPIPHDSSGHTQRAALACVFVLCWLSPLALTRSHAVVKALAACKLRGEPIADSFSAPAADGPPLSSVFARLRLRLPGHKSFPSAPAGDERTALLDLPDSSSAPASPQESKPVAAAEAGTFKWQVLDGPVRAVVVDATIGQMCSTVESWLIVFIVSVLFGSGMMVTVNSAQLLRARGQQALTGPALTIFSVGGAVGRLSGGLLADWLREAFAAPVSASLFVDLAVMVAAHSALSWAVDEFGTLLGFSLAGAAFGAAWPHLVLVTAECFGKAHLGANYGFFDGICQAFGSLLLAKFLTGHVYAAHARQAGLPGTERQQHAFAENDCYGHACFADAHACIVALCALAACATALLMRMQYQRLR
ncbi:major facilitator superfamily domain-containing protein [Pavlovales sp. CCMP2436]|nr:major facilitator superfamily domain-containing protein [Pavlovales sp. CCMP2436]|mmetsp:Transcript_51527/g.120992  ORF Transcript_51527/g.120992 Transcript_51527/m.120992 type:complete len:624 (-) Transcript_51527:64-1935(-)